MIGNRMLGAIIVVLFLAGCGGGSSSSVELSDEQVALNQNLAQWEEARIESYEYQYRRSCFCPPLEARVRVQGGEVAEAFYTADGTYLSDSESEGLYTVSELFTVVQNAINEGAHSLEVDYHATLGYPTRIAIDWDEQVVDDEISHYAQSLR